MRKALLNRQDSNCLIAEIVLNPDTRDNERINRLRSTWHSKKFSDDVEEKLRLFIKKHKDELPAYSIK